MDEAAVAKRKQIKRFKGTRLCYCVSLSFVNTSHTGYINPVHFSQNRFISEIS